MLPVGTERILHTMEIVMSLYPPFEQTSSPRAPRGKDLMRFVPNYVAVDLETTGLDPRRGRIIEFGAVRVIGGCIDERFASLVNPGRPLDPFITRLTGITDAMLEDAPSIGEVLPAFLTFAGEAIILGHNVNFDLGFLYEACARELSRPFPNDFVDTMRLSRRLFPQFAHHKLSDLVFRFGIGEAVEHRALADVIQTIDCYEHMKTYARARGFGDAPPRSAKRAPRAADIRTDRVDFDETCACYGKTFAFTGELSRMSRTEAMQKVADRGGTCTDSVTRRTGFLVLGGGDPYDLAGGPKSAKHKKAEQLMLQGFEIELVSEETFYEMIEE